MMDVVERRGTGVLCIGGADGCGRGLVTMTDHAHGSMEEPSCYDAIARAWPFDGNAIIEAAIKFLN